MFKYWSTESIVQNEGTNRWKGMERICSAEFHTVLQLNGHNSMSLAKDIEKGQENLPSQSSLCRAYHDLSGQNNFYGKWDDITIQDINPDPGSDPGQDPDPTPIIDIDAIDMIGRTMYAFRNLSVTNRIDDPTEIGIQSTSHDESHFRITCTMECITSRNDAYGNTEDYSGGREWNPAMESSYANTQSDSHSRGSKKEEEHDG